MKTVVLTRWEVDEFIEQVSIRSKLWFGKDLLWVRRLDGVNRYAVKFVHDGDDTSVMYIRRLNTEETLEELEEHIEFLLKKFTSYGWRMQVERYLRLELLGWEEGTDADFQRMARNITRPETVEKTVVEIRKDEEPFEAPPSCVAETPIEPVEQVQLVDAIKESEQERVKIDEPPVVKRSRYLQNLLKGKQ